MSELRDKFRQSLEVKEDKTPTFFGYLGDSTGVVSVPGMNNYVYVTMSDGMVTQAYNTVVPPILNLPVVCGYDPRQKQGKLLCVLTVRNVPRVIQSVTEQPLLTKHHKSHEYLNTDDGQDVVWVELRQFMPLRPSVVEPYSIRIKRAVLQINGTWKQVGGVVVNLSNYLPTTTNPNLSGSAVLSRYVVLSIDKASGSPVVTAGSLVPITTLALTDIPTYPTGNYPVCAVRMHHYQTRFYEAATTTDLIDLRFSTMATATSGVSSPQTKVPVAGYYLTGYNATSGSFSSGSFVSPQAKAPVANFYLTGYNAVSGSFSSGSLLAGGSQVVPLTHAPVTDFYLTGYDAISGSFSSGSVVAGSGSGAGFSGSHNELPGLQGGGLNPDTLEIDYYHLSYPEYVTATQLSGSGTTGLLSAEDWLRFNLASGSGAQYLSDLLDVDIGAQTNGQALVWNEDTSKWIPGTVSSGSGTSGSQVVPLDHDPVSNFYLTGYDNATGLFTSGSVAGSGSGGTTADTNILMVQVFT